jgi:hypothetical protein
MDQAYGPARHLFEPRIKLELWLAGSVWCANYVRDRTRTSPARLLVPKFNMRSLSSATVYCRYQLAAMTPAVQWQTYEGRQRGRFCHIRTIR